MGRGLSGRAGQGRPLTGSCFAANARTASENKSLLTIRASSFTCSGALQRGMEVPESGEWGSLPWLRHR